MLYTIAVILLIAWLLGIVGTYTIGAFVHVLLVIAIVLFLVGLISGLQLSEDYRRTSYGSIGVPCHHCLFSVSRKIAKWRWGASFEALPDVPA